MKTKAAVILALVLTGALAVSGVFMVGTTPFGGGEAEAAPSSAGERAPVETVLALKGAISETLAMTGTVAPYRVARLASPAEGPVGDVRVREGDRVSAGDELLSIGRKKGVDALVQSLRVALEKEAANLSHTRRLVEQEALPGEEKDKARAAYESVRAELVRAKEAAADHFIVAPWDGVVSDMFVKEGGFVSPHADLLEIYDPDSQVIRAGVPERYAGRIEVGIPVEIRLDAYPGDRFKGTIARVHPYLDAGMRTRTVEIRPEEEIALLPGMFARLSLRLKTVEDAVLVPSEAVQRDAEDAFVFVVENDAAVRRIVATGIEKDGQTQIRSGVEVGEVVIVAGMAGLADGESVSPTPSGRHIDQPGGAGSETQ